MNYLLWNSETPGMVCAITGLLDPLCTAPLQAKVITSSFIVGKEKTQSTKPTNLKVPEKAFVDCVEYAEFCKATAYSS